MSEYRPFTAPNRSLSTLTRDPIMVTDPRTASDIYDSVRDELTSRIAKLTNFVSGSFNNAFLLSYSDQVREAEIKALAAELAGYVDYAGKSLTEEDLRVLGVENVSADRVNRYMDDRQLDLLAQNFNVQRDLGTRAFGELTITTNNSTQIQEGTPVGTQPDNNGDYTQFRVTNVSNRENYNPDSNEQISLSGGDNTVTVIADDVGTDYNVGTDTITFLPNPAPNITGITNPNPIEGGEDVESNGELRGRIKTSQLATSNGGTEESIKRFIEENGTGVNDVEIVEFEDQQPIAVDVIVLGGSKSELETLKDRSKPVGVKHRVLRPNDINLDIFASVSGDTASIDTSFIRNEVGVALGELQLGDRFSTSAILNQIITAQSVVESVPTLNTYIESVEREQFRYQSGTDLYTLSDVPLGVVNDEEHFYDGTSRTFELFYDDVDASSVNVEVVQNDQPQQVADADLTITDSDGDGSDDTVEIDAGVTIDTRTGVSIDYETTAFDITTVEGIDGVTYQESTDYGLVDNDGDGTVDTIDWSIGGETPDDEDRFVVDYTVRRSFEGDLLANNRQLFSLNNTRVDINQ